MSRKPSADLPDLDDEDVLYRRKMASLVERTLPSDRRPAESDIRINGTPANRISGVVEAARQQALIEAARGSKRRFEYLIPDRVGRALAADAASRGQSATTRLLEVLREAGYPVIDEDLIDLRKMPKR